MNKSTSLSLLVAASVAVSSLSAATSDIVGYVTETVAPNQFNLLGLNLSNSVAAAGAFESASGTTLTDNEGDFLNALGGGGEFVVKITSGSGSVGISTSVVAASATELTAGDDISSFVSAGSSYEIRKQLTIADVFGEANEADLAGASQGDTSGADLVWVPDGAGGFTTYYYNEVARTFPPLTVGWKSTTGGNADASGDSIFFTDGVFVQVQRTSFDSSEAGYVDASTKNIIISGAVQSDDTQVVVENGFTFLSRVFPGDVTLAESGLELELVQASQGDTSSADFVWIPDGSGGYNVYYYNGVARTFPPLSVGWKGTVTGNADASSEVLGSAFAIQRAGDARMITLRIPADVASNL